MADLEKIADQLSELTVIEAADLANFWKRNGAYPPLHLLQLPLLVAAQVVMRLRQKSRRNLTSFWPLSVTRRSMSSRKFAPLPALA